MRSERSTPTDRGADIAASAESRTAGRSPSISRKLSANNSRGPPRKALRDSLVRVCGTIAAVSICMQGATIAVARVGPAGACP